MANGVTSTPSTPPRYRRSRLRTSILDYLKKSDDHPSAEAIHEALKDEHPTMSFGTVYRNLNILVDQGVVVRLESSRERDRFDAVLDRHIHFHCTQCGEVYDLPEPKDVARYAKKALGDSGHQIENQKLELYGICATCFETD